MTDRRRYSEREPWPWWKRATVGTGRWSFNLLIGPFLTKLPDGTVQASMTRVAVAAFTVVECFRLLPQNGPGEMRLVPVIGWADAFLAFCVLFALPIDAAMSKAKPQEVLGLLGRMRGQGDDVQAVTVQQTASVTTPEAGEGDA